MNKLHQAYIDLGLQPGAPFDDVLDRWRTVARMWHPDRAGSEKERLIAENELKKINSARDLLAKHFQAGEHQLANCKCSMRESGEETSSTSEAPSQSPPQASPPPRQSKTSASRAVNAAWRAACRQPRRAAVMALITVAMVIVGTSAIHTNSGIRIRRTAEAVLPETADTPSVRGGMTSADYDPLSPVLKVAIRPSSFGLSPTAEKPASEVRVKPEPVKAESPKLPLAPKNTSAITFVSSDGRLVSLKDGTTWELSSTEAADSFFQWEADDHITLKGLESSPSWLVNESRGFQAVKVNPVR